MVGRTIAERYRLEEHLGTGGMGDVWRATDLRLRETVALKRPKDGDVRREARIGAELSHPNVIAVHGTVTDGDEQWLVMEYLPARSLAEIIETDGPIGEQRAARIGAQLADALNAMHAKGMVHRDVKPGNVLVTGDDVAKLSDFGISRWAEQTRVGGGDVAGTAAYLAPEVADGHEARPSADIFALGATLFAAVEGTSPWGSPDAGTAEQLRRAKAYDITPPQRPGPFGDLLAQFLRRDPHERPAAENAKALLEGVKLPNPRRRKVITFSAVALVAVVAAGAVVWSQLPKPGTVGDPRTMNVCGLALDDASRFGARAIHTDEVNSYWFSGCTSWLTFTDDPDKGVLVDYTVKLLVPEAGARPNGVLGPVTPGKSADDKCVRTIELVDGNVLLVEVKPGGDPDRPLCRIADTASEHARSVLADKPIPRRATPWPAESLGNVDSCALLTKDALVAQLRSYATPYHWNEMGNWGCGWDFGSRTVQIEFSRQQPFDAKDGTPVDVGRGHVARVEPDDSPDATDCDVNILQRVARPAPDERIEVVRVILRDQATRDTTTLCPGAVELAKVVVSKLP